MDATPTSSRADQMTASPSGAAASHQPNVPNQERWLSGLAGSALLIWGMRQRTPVGWAVAGSGGYLLYRGASGRCMLYSALGAPAAQAGDTVGAPRRQPTVTIERAVTVNRSVDDVRHWWSDPNNIVRVTPMLESATPADEGRTRWVASGPRGTSLTWETEIDHDLSPDGFEWRSVPGGDLTISGLVRFTPAPGHRGTEVYVRVVLEPPGGPVATLLAKRAVSSPADPVAMALRRMKQLLEIGDITTTLGQPRGGQSRPTPPTLTPRTSPSAGHAASADRHPDQPMDDPEAVAATPPLHDPAVTTRFAEAETASGQ